jgi:deoxyribonuclease-1
MSISHKECGFQAKKMKKRAFRIEWEHIVPAHAFGHSFLSWRNGHEKCRGKKKNYKGRRCAQKVESQFNYMEADLYNLFPSVGAINQARSNFSMAEIAGVEGKIFGACPIKIKDRKIEPPAQVKGDIARVYFYMNKAYPSRGIISDKNEKLFTAWDKQDPVDQNECQRNLKIEQIQKNANEFVKNACVKLYPAIFKTNDKTLPKSGKTIN